MRYRTETHTHTHTQRGMTEKEIYSDRVKPQWGEPDKTRHVRHTAVTRKLAFREMPPTSASQTSENRQEVWSTSLFIFVKNCPFKQKGAV